MKRENWGKKKKTHKPTLMFLMWRNALISNYAYRSRNIFKGLICSISIARHSCLPGGSIELWHKWDQSHSTEGKLQLGGFNATSCAESKQVRSSKAGVYTLTGTQSFQPKKAQGLQKGREVCEWVSECVWKERGEEKEGVSLGKEKEEGSLPQGQVLRAI